MELSSTATIPEISGTQHREEHNGCSLACGCWACWVIGVLCCCQGTFPPLVTPGGGGGGGADSTPWGGGGTPGG
jgi:hypothetical protein